MEKLMISFLFAVGLEFLAMITVALVFGSISIDVPWYSGVAYVLLMLFIWGFFWKVIGNA